MRTALLGAFAAFLLLSIPRPGQGAAAYIDSTRFVHHIDLMGSSGGYVHAEPPGQYPDEWVYMCGDGDCSYWGTQDSRIFAGDPFTSPVAPSGWGEVGIVDNGAGIPVDAIAYYQAIFEVDAPLAYELSGSVVGPEIYSPGPDPFTVNDVAVRLTGPGGSIFDTQGQYGSFLSTGILGPGVYEIEAIADYTTLGHTDFDYSAYWGFTLDLPEPGTPTLLGLSLLVLALIRGRGPRRAD